ncbi:TolC family protein [Providencia alcalifaciens]|uniref:Outer membrane efflux protein n=1 Tax=Providencia alcalifaciens DSM 30120 TaxID=520999 RepID=B6XAA8_9GAMM|nr:TolC family protein [Providencia alcalifaciens]ATG14966.1 TolC family protein [Providencia alcalifaciens]EEB47661.1 outer membrane efflux protein [Providencia alcalifaciens DSM 30120]
MKSMINGILALVFVKMFSLSAVADVVELKNLLKDSLDSAPEVQEAYANYQAAQSNVSAAEAGHYPVVSLMGTQPLAQQHKYESNAMESGFHLGTKATMNIYSWGGIEAGVDREQSKQSYYENQYILSQEDISVRISQLYLQVLRHKETLDVIDENLVRHHQIAKQLTTIVQHDSGRMSELTQVKARTLKVEMSRAETERNLNLALSQLSILTQRQLTVDQFVDPFRSTTSGVILARFQDDNLENNPSYKAQVADAQSLNADVKVASAMRKPALNLEVSATPDNSEVFLRVSWNIFDQASYYSQAQKEYALSAANERIKKTFREIKEMSQSAAINMAQSEKQGNIAKAYIAEQKVVISNYEKQFTINRRTLIDLLDAYNELASIQTSAVILQNDFRDATLNYLSVQAKMSAWMNQELASR